MKVLWTEQAYARLASIYDYLARDNADAAARVVDEIINRTDRLEKYPRRGRRVPELSDPNLRELVYLNYRIVYRVRKNTVEVVTIFEGHLPLPDEDVNDE